MKEQLSLTQDGVEMVDYPTSAQAQVARAADAWQQFIKLDQSIKDLYAAASLQSGTGYERKGSGERESHDIKENFDITRASLADLAASNTNTAIAAEFIAAASKLFDELETLIVATGQSIQTQYGVTGFAQEAHASAEFAFVRFLQYPPVPEGTIIGEPHVDHSGFTFHLYESTSGCERMTFGTDTWEPMPVSSSQAAVFASMQTQLFSEGKIKGLCHRIIATPTTAESGRTAIVCFVPLIHLPPYDRATHGRLQEMTPGFNYGIDADEFAKLFKQ